MTTTTSKVLGASALGLIMAAGSVAAAVPSDALAVPAAGDEAAQEAAVEASAVPARATAKVEGAFSFTQEAVTDNGYISQVFRKASAVLCQAPYLAEAAEAGLPIQVTGSVDEGFTVQVGEDDGQGRETKLVGCACSTNGPGGGAVANAEVAGLTLEALAVQAGAR